ncbi:hypothetical protein [Lentzea sp. NPDC004782]|uniref:hypothetical protein n=1 Tax=Lentzea sp. NPDC004782 TaxID=3154458 RepID=UPI0033AFA5EB
MTSRNADDEQGANDMSCEAVAAGGDLMRPGHDGDSDVRQRAAELRQRGFQQTQVVDPDTHQVAWMWARVWKGVRDAVIATHDGALGYRVWDADFDPHKPFVVEDDIALWRRVGNFISVSSELLAIEDLPHMRGYFSRRAAERVNPPS